MKNQKQVPQKLFLMWFFIAMFYMGLCLYTSFTLHKTRKDYYKTLVEYLEFKKYIKAELIKIDSLIQLQ